MLSESVEPDLERERERVERTLVPAYVATSSSASMPGMRSSTFLNATPRSYTTVIELVKTSFLTLGAARHASTTHRVPSTLTARHTALVAWACGLAVWNTVVARERRSASATLEGDVMSVWRKR